MRRIAVLAAAAAALLLPHPAQAQDACESVVTQGPCRGAEQLVSAAEQECRIAGACPRYSVAAHRASWLHRALADQYERGAPLTMLEAPWLGTHNSFNSVQAMPALSQTDANQQLSLHDQLELDVRSLELDVHSTPRGPVVCHGQGEGLGCTTERDFATVADEVGDWLDAHRDQVLLVYLEDHLRAADEATVIAQALARWRVHSALGRDFPSLTRAQVRAAGDQVILVGGSGSHPSWQHVFAWGPHEWEDRNHGFAGCRNEGEEPPYASRLIRFYEDSTWLTAQAELAGQSRTDDGLDPATVRAMLACGVDLLGLDQLVPGDPRLDAAVWSWAEGVDPAACAVLREDGRWLASDCTGNRRAACRRPGGSWVLSPPVPVGVARRACGAVGGTFAAPRSGAENAALASLTDLRVWLGV